MRRPSSRDERGIVGVVLTIVIIFALIAVIELTRTLEAAQSINTTVQNITGSVQGANSHLNTGCQTGTDNAEQNCPTDALPVLNTTVSEVAAIDAAAKPLSGEASQILTSVGSINTTASAILANASSINGTVHSISGLAGSINSSVNGIHNSISGINSDVTTAQAGISLINQNVDTVIGSVNGIKGDTSTINGQAGSIKTQATDICNAHILGLIGLGTTC
jgi:hypothetical protein